MGILATLLDPLPDGSGNPLQYLPEPKWAKVYPQYGMNSIDPGAAARKRMDERLGIPECDLSWLDEVKKPLEDR